MFTLVRYDVFWIVPVLIITAREVGHQRLPHRWPGATGVSVPAKQLAKVKTVVPAARRRPRAAAAHRPRRRWLCNTFLWVAVVLTVVTGGAVPRGRPGGLVAPRARRRACIATP